MTDPPTAPGSPTAGAGEKPRTVAAGLVGVALLIVGILGTLLVPTMLMFSEGIPRDFPGGPGAYLGIGALLSAISLLAGFGIVRSREWGRVLGLATLVVFTALLAPSALLFIPVALQFILLRRWRIP